MSALPGRHWCERCEIEHIATEPMCLACRGALAIQAPVPKPPRDRADGSQVEAEWRGDPDRPRGHLVRGKRALLPHELLFRRNAIHKDHHDAAARYLKHYQIGLGGARNAMEPRVDCDARDRLHDTQAHHAHELLRAQQAMRPHERALVDAVVLAGMSLDGYAVEVLRLVESQPVRIGRVTGMLISALETLCHVWRIGTFVGARTKPLDTTLSHVA